MMQSLALALTLNHRRSILVGARYIVYVCRILRPSYAPSIHLSLSANSREKYEYGH